MSVLETPAVEQATASPDGCVPIDGGCLATPGYEAAAAASGVKSDGALDLAVLCSRAPATAAAVFTQSAAAAAPVFVSRRRLQRSAGQVRGIVVNSGNANALTGGRGARDALALVRRTEQQLRDRQRSGAVLSLSTGVIGVPLPTERILPALDEVVGRLGQAPASAADRQFAQAMLTTDTCIKQCAVRVELPATADHPAGTVVVGGTAKGSGMIHPNMATMLGVVTTDARVAPDALQDLLGTAVDRSFNRISVDGDTSTNDAVILMARDGSFHEPALQRGDPRLETLAAAVEHVCQSLARQIVLDGEGVTRIANITVRGAVDEASAAHIAGTIATSPLVKTAIHGGDANWGRVLAAAGRADTTLDFRKASLSFGDVTVFAEGAPTDYSEDEATVEFQRPEVELTLDLGAGSGAATVHTTDLSHRYIDINASYRS